MIISNFDRKLAHEMDSDVRRIPRDFMAYAEWNKKNSSRLRGIDAYTREKLFYAEITCKGLGD